MRVFIFSKETFGAKNTVQSHTFSYFVTTFNHEIYDDLTKIVLSFFLQFASLQVISCELLPDGRTKKMVWMKLGQRL